MYRQLAETISLMSRGMAESKQPEDRKIASGYLAALAPLLAATVLGETILRKLDDIDRLFGHTWLINEEPFSNAMASWRTFRDEYETWVLGGMTVHERLFELGLLDDFELARSGKDTGRMTEILRRIRIDESDIKGIIGGNV